MSLCEKDIKGLIRDNINLKIKATGLGVVEGGRYVFDQNIIDTLDPIATSTGVRLYVVSDSGNEILISYSIPDSLTQAYLSNKVAGVYKKEQNFFDIDYEQLATDIQQTASGNERALKRMLDSVLISSQQTISRLRKEGADSNDIENFAKVVAEIRENPDKKAAMVAIARFVAESSATLRGVRDTLPKIKAEISDPTLSTSEKQAAYERAFYILANFMETASVYESTLSDLGEVTSGSADNDFKDMVAGAERDLKEIKNLYNLVAKEVSLDKIYGNAEHKYLRLKQRHEAEIARLEKIKVTASPKRKISIQRKIDRLKSDFKRLSPSSENLEAHLIGDAGDASLVSKFLISGIENSDLLVAGFTKLIKDALSRAAKAFKEKSNEYIIRFQELKQKGFTEADFRELHINVEQFRYDEDTDSIVSYFVKFFDDEVSHGWRTPYSRFRAEIAQLNLKIDKARKEGSSTTELENQLTEKSLDFVKWKRDNLEGEFDERYQNTQRILDQTFIIGGRVVSLQEIRQEHFRVITDIQARIDTFQGGVPTDTDIAEIQAEREKYDKMRVPSNFTSGTIEYDIAVALEDYHARMTDMTDKWEITPQSLQKFVRTKASIDAKFERGDITEEERDRWYQTNTTITFDPRYWTSRRDILQRVADIASEMEALSGDATKVDLTYLYSALEGIAKPYRDTDSFIDGRRATEGERAASKNVEVQIETVKRAGREAFNGFLGDEYRMRVAFIDNQRQAYLESLKSMQRLGSKGNEEIREDMKSIRASLRALKEEEANLVDEILERRGLSVEQIILFKERYKEYKKLLRTFGEMTVSQNTSYYYDEFDSQLKQFIADATPKQWARARKTNPVIGGKEYAKSDDGFYYPLLSGKGGTKTFGSGPVYTEAEIVDELFRPVFISESKWYQDNHFEAEIWDSDNKEFIKGKKPLYMWRYTKPSNKNFIKEESPNISWKRRVIKKEYRNPNGGLDIDGKPKAKKDKWENKEYQARKAARPELYRFRDYMIGEYLAAQEFYDEKDRMGLRVPSVERDLNATNITEKSILTSTWEKIKRGYTLTEQDREEGLAQSDEAGFEKRVVPVMLRGRLDPDLVSENVLETVGKYVGQSFVYKERVNVSKIARAVETTLEHENHTPASTSQSKLAKYLGIERFLKKRGSNQRLDTVRDISKMLIYGETVFEETESGRRWYKILTSLLGTRSATLFAGTFSAQGVNLVGGMVQQIIKTGINNGSAKFGMKDWLWAQKEFLANGASFVRDTGRVTNKSFWTQFAEEYDVNDMGLIDNFGEEYNKQGLIKNIRFNQLAVFKTVVEHELFMTTLMAFSNNYLVNTTKGEKIKLRDAYELVGGVMVLKPDVLLSENERNDIKGYINNLMRDINGNYNKLDKTVAEGYWFGKAMLFMRKWIIPQVLHRWGGQKFSYEQDRIIEGFYLTTAGYYRDKLFDGDWKALATILYTGADKTMSDTERDAINRTKREVMLLVGLTLLIKYALGYDDEDEDRFKDLKKQSPTHQYLTYVFVKATSEQSVFLPVVNAMEVQKLQKNAFSNVFPYANEVIDILRKDFDWESILDKDDPFLVRYKRKTGIHNKGDIRLASDMWKLLGYTAAKGDPVEALKSFEQNLNK